MARKLAYTRGRQVLNAFRAPILADRPATWAETVQLTDDEANVEFVDVSPDGRLVISSNRSGNWEIYLLPAGGGDLMALVTDPALDAGPRWSPDGREMAFYSSRTGHREVWILPAGGGQAAATDPELF
jgi:Tol biopolymer transport system component